METPLCQISNNGACLSLYEIGLLRYNEDKELDPVVYSQNWDAQYVLNAPPRAFLASLMSLTALSFSFACFSVMRGCACSRAISVDGQYDVDYNRMIGNFYFNQTTNRTQLYSDEDVHKFYRCNITIYTVPTAQLPNCAVTTIYYMLLMQRPVRVRRH